jgi:uncharacterized protein YggU (UPF0235/DUF167 family)
MKPNSELSVRVTPRSSREKLEFVNGQLKAWVMASPTDGQANEAVCRAVARALKVPPSTVSVKRGHASREKALNIEGLDETELQIRLTAL